MRHLIYDVATGVILSSGHMTPDQLQANLQPGQAALVLKADAAAVSDANLMVIDGALVSAAQDDELVMSPTGEPLPGDLVGCVLFQLSPVNSNV